MLLLTQNQNFNSPQDPLHQKSVHFSPNYQKYKMGTFFETVYTKCFSVDDTDAAAAAEI